MMDHHLILLAQEKSLPPAHHEKDYDSEGDNPASILVFDLLDHSVQEAEIDVDLFAYQSFSSFVRYGENQILRYYSSDEDMGNYNYKQSFVCITVESFKRKRFGSFFI